jgi:ABC-type transport system substrate-binding protein
MKLRLCLFLAVISAVLAGAVASQPARRPRYGGTLRVEIGAIVNSLDPNVAAANPQEAEAKEQLDALIYDGSNPEGASASVAGSGAFRVSSWEAGKRAIFSANEDYREGRPFVDSIEIEMGRTAHERELDLELNKTDFAEIPAEQARQAADRGMRLSTSRPNELLALVFLKARGAAADARAREAIARCIDRAAIVNFILQKEGEPAGGLLPQWSSGTAFLFSTSPDAGSAKEIASHIAAPAKLVLGYDSADTLEQSVAERIVVNAKEAGIALMSRAIPAPGTPPVHGTEALANRTVHVDAQLVRLRMPSPVARVSLAAFVATLGPLAGIADSPLPQSASPQDVYYSERSIMNSGLVVPLVWLPQVYGLSARVRDWTPPVAGESWPLADVWLEPADAR